MKKAIARDSAKESKTRKENRFPKKYPMLTHATEIERSDAIVMAAALGSFILFNTCDSKVSGKNPKNKTVSIQIPGKKCALETGDYALQKNNTIHFKDDFPGADVPLRFDAHFYWKLEAVDNNYGLNLKKSRITKNEFDSLKAGAKGVFSGPVDVQGADIVYMEQSSIESVICQPENKDIQHPPSMYIGMMAAAALVLVVLSVLSFRLYSQCKKLTDKLVESKKHAEKEEQKHSEN